MTSKIIPSVTLSNDIYFTNPLDLRGHIPGLLSRMDIQSRTCETHMTAAAQWQEYRDIEDIGIVLQREERKEWVISLLHPWDTTNIQPPTNTTFTSLQAVWEYLMKAFSYN